MKEDVCIISFESNDEQAFGMDGADIVEEPFNYGSDVENDFKELNEEIGKIVDGVKSSNISRNGSRNSTLKETNNSFQLIKSTIWENKNDGDDSGIFSMKYEELQSSKKFVKKSSFKKAEMDERDEKNFNASDNLPEKLIVEIEELNPIEIEKNELVVIQSENSFTNGRNCANSVNDIKPQIQFDSNNLHREKISFQNNINEFSKKFTPKYMECKSSVTNENFIPKYYNNNKIGQNFVNNCYVDFNVNNYTNSNNKFPAFSEKLQNQLIFNYNNNINMLNHNNKNVTSQSLIKSINHFYSNNYMIGKFPSTIENTTSCCKNEVCQGTQNYNKVKSGKKSKKQSHNENKYASKGLDDDHNRINLENVIKGKEKRTTIMIRHIPNKYQIKTIIEEINQDFNNKYDLFYLPLDYENKCNLGFAFINFIDPMHVVLFYNNFRGKKWKKFNSEKICDLAYAKFQGKKDLIAHFEKGANMNFESDDKKPIILLNPNPIPKIEMPMTYLNAFLTVYPYSNIAVNYDKFIIESFYNC